MPPKAPNRVPSIPGVPLPYGLLNSDCIEVVPAQQRDLMGVDWLSTVCCDAGCTTWCPPDTDPCSIPEKEFCRPDTFDAEPITIYAGVECDLLGFSYEEAAARARDALRLGRSKSLEQWVWNNILTLRATDITPAAGAVSWPEALALLEGMMAMESGARGVIHAPAAASALLDFHNLVERCGACEGTQGSVTTGLGNCVVLAAGYQANNGPRDPGDPVADPPVPPGDLEPAPAGELWLYASGPVLVREDTPSVYPDTEGAAFDRANCATMAVAEQTFLVLVDCPVLAIRARVCPCGC
jgi:hypothetical protein